MVKKIIQESSSIVRENKGKLFGVFLFLNILQLSQQFFLQLGMIGVVLSLLLTAMDHASVVSGLKAVGQIDEVIDPKKDGLCGLARLKTLFSTYFSMNLIVLVLFFLFILLFFKISNLIFHDISFWDGLIAQVAYEAKYGISSTANQVLAWTMFAMLAAISLSQFIVQWLFFLAPYELEIKQIKGIEALKVAWHELKGYRKQTFFLELHYFIMMIFFSCINYLCMTCISNVLLSSAASFASLLAAIYVYRMEYAVSRALLCQKIWLEKETV